MKPLHFLREISRAGWLSLVWLLLPSLPVFSQPTPTITWAGAASGDWNVAANWSPVRVPNTNDHVLIDRAGGARVRLNAAASVASLTLGGSLGATQQLVMDLSFNLTVATNSLVGAFSTLAMTNGSILGAGLLEVAGRWDWAGGTLAAAANVRAGGRLDLVTTSDKFLNSGSDAFPAVLTNQATVRQLGGTLYLNFSGRVENLGEWRVEKDGVVFSRNVAGFGTFWNRNLFAKVAGSGTANIQQLAQFQNFGVVSNSSGVLDFNQNSTWADGSVLAGPGTNRFAGGAFALNGTIQLLGTLELTGGTLSGQWVFGGAGPFRWQGGVVGGSMTWPSGLAVELATASDKFLSSGSDASPAVLTNQTTARHLGGTLYLNHSSRVENLGEWRVEKDGTVFLRSVAGFGTFWNRNLFTKVAGTGIASIQQLSQFQNLGVVSNASGVLEFAQNCTWADGSVLTGAGTNRFTSGTQTLNGTLTVMSPMEFVGSAVVSGGTNRMEIQKYLLLAGGTLGGNWSFANGAGPFRWTSGVVAGVMTWPAGLAVELATSTDKYLSSGNDATPAVLTNQTIVRQTGGTLYLNFNSRIENEAQWRVETDGYIFYRNTGGFGTFWNRNLFAKVAGPGAALIQQLAQFQNFGVVSNASGVIEFAQNCTWANGSTLTGPGTNRFAFGTQTVNGTLDVRSPLEITGGVTFLAGTNRVQVHKYLLLAGGTLGGTWSFENGSGPFRWTSGVVAGAMTWPAGLAVELATTTDKYLSSGNDATPAVLTNRTTVRQTGGTLYLNNNARVENEVLWQVETDGYIFYRNSGGFGTFWNRNLFAKVAGPGAALVQQLAQFHNLGVVSNASGVIEFALNCTWANGSTLTGPGTNRFAFGTQTVNGTLAVTSPLEITSSGVNFSAGTNRVQVHKYLLLAGGTLGGIWSFENGSGPFRWTSGVVAGAMTWPAGLAVELATTTDKYLSSGDNNSPAVLTNQATVRHTGGTLYLNHAARVENLAPWHVEMNGDVFYRNTGNTGQFQNRGDFSKADSAGTVTIQAINFTNWGRLIVPRGEIFFGNNPQDLGPGILRVGLGGPTILTDGGRVRFTGQGRLNGPLEIALTNGFAPAPDQTVEVARFASRSGKFTAVSAPPAPDGYAWNVTYDNLTARLFLAPAGLPAGLVAYYPAEGTAQDVVGIHHGTNQNGAAFAPGKVGQAFSLDGTNDLIHLGFWSPGSQWTMAAWVKPAATPAGRRGIVGGMNEFLDWALTMQNGVLGAAVRSSAGSALTILSGTNAIPGQWYHLVATSDGATARVYVNGQFTASAAVSPNYVGTTSGTLIGGEACCVGANFPGLVDEVAIFDRPIGPDEIAAMYNNGNGGPLLNCITPAAGLAVSLSGENNALNAAGLPHAVWQGTPGYATGQVHQAFSFDGVTDYLELSDSPTVRPASLTFECWFNASNSLAVLASKPLGVGVLDSFVVWLQSGELRASIAGNGIQAPPLIAPFTPVPGVWSHAAYTFDAASGTQTLYLNGAPVATAIAAIFITYDSHPLLLGADLGFGSLNSLLHGQLDEVALYHRALSQSEISLIYAAGSSGRCHGGGPAVVAVAPAPYLTNDFNRLLATFNTVVDPATFSGADVTISGPGGGVPAAGITAALTTNVTGREFEILFPTQTLEGTYAVSIGTNIQNVFSNFAASVFSTTLTFDKTGPRVTNATPAGTITTLPSFFEVTFNTDILIGSFTTADAALTGPGASAIANVQRLNARQYRVNLATALPPGTFQLSVGPNINDLAGNAMDQDADGLRGEVPGDVFSSSLIIEIAELAVGGLQVPASIVVGQPVEIVWAVTNVGTVPASAPWNDAVRFGTSAGGGGATLANFPQATSLAAGAFLIRTGVVVMPFGNSGAKYFSVSVDSGNQVAELNEANNTIVTPSTIPLLVPDLAVETFNVPGPAVFGSNLFFNWSVRNAGTARAEAAWSDSIYLSSDAVFGNGDTLLLAMPAALAPLNPSVSYTQSTQVVLPLMATLPPGNYYLLARADSGQMQPELTETNNLRSFGPINITLPPLPDLVVTNIVAPEAAAPGETVTLIWTVQNQGTAAAVSPWTERVFLSTDTNAGNDTFLMQLVSSNALAVGDVLTRTQAVVVPQTITSGELFFVIQVDALGEWFELNEGNNLTVDDIAVPVPTSLTLDAALTSIREDATPNTIRMTVTRSGLLTSNLVVQLASSSTNDLTVPPTATILAGQARTTLDATVHPDGVVDGAKAVAISATASNVAGGQAVVTVLDVNIPVLTLNFSGASVVEGQLASATLFTDTASTQDVEVFLVSSDSAQLAVPESVIIPSNSLSVGFTALALDDTFLENDVTVQVNASAGGYRESDAAILIKDNDDPQLVVELTPGAVSEGSGGTALSARLRRNGSTNLAVVAKLTSSDTTELIVPGSVLLQAGESSVTFPALAVDDNLLDGPQAVSVTAQAVTTFGNLPFGTNASATVNITDDDGPALSVSLDRTLAPEGLPAGARATIHRNGGTNSALIVNLSSSDPTEATVPVQVVIPANSFGVVVDVATVQDNTPDGNQTVLINANAAGYAVGAARLVVSDVDLPDLIVTDVTSPVVGETAELLSMSYRLSNQGLSPATGSNWIQRVYLSTNGVLDATDTLLGEFTFSGNMPPGQFFQQALSFFMPREPGEYWFLVEADAEKRVAEVLENNNVGVSAIPIRIEPSYTATVATSVEVAPAGTPVPLTGTAQKRLGGPAQFELVNLHLQVRGVMRVIAALTDATGHFSAQFQPLPGEAGHYTIGAAHPGLATADVQDQFDLIGLAANPSQIISRVIALGNVSGQIQLRNLGEQPLTGVQAAAMGAVNLQVNATVTNLIPASGEVTLQYQITSLADELAITSFSLNVTTAQGISLSIPVAVTVQPATPRLEVRPSSIRAGMVRGEQGSLELEVVNHGGAESGPIQVILPDLPWLSVASTNPAPSIPPQGTNLITLQMTPGTNLPLGEFEGTLALSTAFSDIPVPFHFKNVSSAVGDVKLTTVDENTFYGNPPRPLTNVTIVLRDQFNNQIVAQGVSDTNGVLAFIGLREGNYNLEASAPKHDLATGVIEVKPGELSEHQLFLRTRLVEVRWTVEPIDFEDRTKITIESVFETTVPVPVVTAEPKVIDLGQVTGPETQIDLTITNHGLIAANDLTINFPTHPNWIITPLVREVGVLPARSSLTVPVRFTRVVPRPGDVSSAGDTPGAPCNIQADIEWKLVCGMFDIAYNAPVLVINVNGDCSGGSWITDTIIYIGNRIPNLLPSLPGGYGGTGGPGGGGLGGGGGERIQVGVRRVPPTYSPTNTCACNDLTYKEKCVKGEGGFKFSTPDSLLTGINTALAPYFAKVNGLSIRFLGAGQVCTCCKNGVKGLKVKGEAGYEIEGKGSLGLSLSNSFTTQVEGIGAVKVKGELLLGGELTIFGGARGTFKTECFLEDPKFCFSYKVGAKAFIGAKGSFSLSAKGPDNVEYGGGAKATGGIEFGGSIEGSACNDGKGLSVKACFDGLVAKAEIEGSIFEKTPNGTTEKYVKIGYTETLVTNRCTQLARPERPDLAEVDALGTMPATNVAHMFGYRSTGAMIQDLSGIAAADLPPGATANDLAHAVGEAQRQAASGVANPLARDEHVHAAGGGGSICAQVRLKIEQEAVLTRKAIGANLEVDNNSETEPLEQLNVTVMIYDADGNVVNNRFVVLAPELAGITVLPPVTSGTNDIAVTLDQWRLPPSGTGRARWVILPLDNAAPTEPVTYYVGGFMTYYSGGVPDGVIFERVPVQVYPNASLHLRYFHERDVFSDDPFTGEIEPSVPYSLAVMVHNSGAGEARKFSITSAQPKIIENEKGLLIDFEIIATEVAGQNLTPTLTASFGDVGPDDTVIGRWLFKSSLQGLFVEYKATFEHEERFGGQIASLIDDVSIHEMNHIVAAPGVFADGKPDFLVNDVEDEGDLPDTIHLSDFSTQQVFTVLGGTVDSPASPGHLTVHLTATMPPGFAYLRTHDPGDGNYILTRVVRSDGVEVPLGVNAWTTDRTFLGLARDPIHENNLHLFDYNSPGSYTLTYVVPPPADLTAPQSVVAALPAQSRTQIPVNWSGTDVGGGIAFFDIFVSIDHGPFLPWLQHTTQPGAIYPGELGRHYAFYSTATDKAGNAESAPGAPDAQTLANLVNTAPQLAPVGALSVPEATTFIYTNVASDTDQPPNVLTFTLAPGAPPGAFLNPASGVLSWTTGEANGPGTNLITVIVRDNGLPSLSATQTIRVIVTEVNTAPTLAALPSRTINEGSLLTVTNVAADLDLPVQQLAFSFGAGVPAGAALNTNNGVFTWRPTETQGGTTNPISIVVRDNGSPPLSTTQTFTVIVRDTRADFSVSLGTTQLLSGASGRVPLTLSSGADLTNAHLVLAVTGDRLTNLNLVALAPEVASANFLALGSNRFDAQFHSRADTFLQGNFQLGQLAFGTVSNEHSSVATVRTESLTGARASSTQPLNGNGGSARIFIIGREPILDGAPTTNRQFQLALYALPDERYALERRLAFDGINAWLPDSQINPTDLKTLLPLRPMTSPQEYFRALLVSGYELTIRVEGNQVVLEWPLECTGCTLLESGQVGAGAVWSPSAQQGQIVSGRYRASLPIGPSPRFYRLAVPGP